MVKTKKNTRMAEQHAASAAAKGRKLDVDVRGKLEVAPPLNGRIFTIIVGTAGKRFEIYEDLLKKHSEYFAAAIDGKFKEAEERVATISSRIVDELGGGSQSREAEAFETFARFLYTGKIFTHCTDSSNKNHCETHSLKNAWVIGEYLLSTTFKDAVVDTYGISKLALRDMYKTVYRISQPTSGIRKLLVAEALYCEDKGWSRKHHDPAHEFFFDVANAFVANLMEAEQRAQWAGPVQEHDLRVPRACWEGGQSVLQRFVDCLRVRLPPLAIIIDNETSESKLDNDHHPALSSSACNTDAVR